MLTGLTIIALALAAAPQVAAQELRCSLEGNPTIMIISLDKDWRPVFGSSTGGVGRPEIFSYHHTELPGISSPGITTAHIAGWGEEVPTFWVLDWSRANVTMIGTRLDTGIVENSQQIRCQRTD
ncbi:hypothetical protein EMQ25_17770 [Arsenicitalea aurantiaca]|uniref:Uncharacterized protein n=1 Tax=Arsenicitalea aurantiaca TaxID=1783274 RepID=A0A433X2N3_9HYPH|nr:hypothetical protein [Arsenicitalea aurantiaca]RUT28242.1 hypothetical protein EMQ25_17770 [Arsenicitalea aurantiaca]